jgi:HEAT repeat protein
MLCRLTLQLLRVSSLTRRAGRLEDAETIEIAASVFERLGITRPVCVLVSTETSVPFSWGIFNPIIVLPPSCASWPRQQKYSVMLHELAHVVRWDYPIHLLIEFVRAIYWPNPLVCVAAKKNALERERACDDFALQRGARSREYARHLIEIALSQLDRAPVGATTMANEPGLFERIRCVMSERVDHSPLGFRRLLAIVCLMLALLGPVASLKVAGHTASAEVPSLDEVIERLQNSDEDSVRRMAAWWLGEMESDRGVEPLVGALRDPSVGVRLATGWALGEIKDAAAVDPLVEVLHEDEDPLVREMAALALGEIDAPDAVRPLVESFEHDDALAAAIVWALGEIRTDEAKTARAAAVATWSGDPSPNREIWVGRLETGERFTADVRHLLHELRFGDSETRRLAAWNFGFLGVLDGLDSIEPVVGPLLDALRDPAPEVRAIAVWALDEINPSRSRARLGTVGADVLHERRLNSLGYYFLVSLGDADRAIEIFKKNVELHPESSNCHDSLGEAYMWTGDVRRAIENYERALELDPKNENAEAMLRELRRPSEAHHTEARVDQRSRS